MSWSRNCPIWVTMWVTLWSLMARFSLWTLALTSLGFGRFLGKPGWQGTFGGGRPKPWTGRCGCDWGLVAICKDNTHTCTLKRFQNYGTLREFGRGPFWLFGLIFWRKLFSKLLKLNPCLLVASAARNPPQGSSLQSWYLKKLDLCHEEH